MQKYLSYSCAFGLGFAFASILANLQPVSGQELLLKGILGFAHDLDAYGVKPEFDPRSCEIAAVPKAKRDDLGSSTIFSCRHNTEKGGFASYRGYDLSGRTTEGEQGFEEVKQ